MKPVKLSIKKGMNILILSASVLITLVVLLLITLLIMSPGKPESFRDKEGNPIPWSLSEKTFVSINGVRQGMIIRGKNIHNPVLLFVHGGPGFPEYFLAERYPAGLEDHFTVCYWEQRGGGLSYDPSLAPETMNFEQLTLDAIEVSKYLKDRFGKEKIYMMAHSGGTAFAIQAAARAPGLYYAYIGMAQITDQAESERIAYRYLFDSYQKKGNVKALRELSKYPVNEVDSLILPFHNSLIRDICMHELGVGTMHKMNSVFRDIFIPVWTCQAYTLKEKVNIWRSKFGFLTKTGLKNEVINTDITRLITKMDIPVYFFSGKYDLTVNCDLSRDYLENLKAPVKGFYLFKESAHSPLFEEPAKVKEILIEDVLYSTTLLASIYRD